jgi:hypothetical protein
MADVYKAVVGLRYPDSADGYKQALAAQTDEDYVGIKWLRTEPGEIVPGYVITASPWLVEQGKVEKTTAPERAPAKTPAAAPAEKKVVK